MLKEKFMKKSIVIFLTIMMTLSCFTFGCKKDNGNGGGTTPTQKPVITMQKGVHYSDQVGVINSDTGLEDVESYDKDVFYRNNAPEHVCADTFVLQCTDVTDSENYGKYFLYGTTGGGVFNSFVSDDLISWEPKYGSYTYPSDGWEYADNWAPEVSYDKDADPADYGLEDDGIGQGVYYFYYSASSTMQYLSGRIFQLGLAVGVTPYGPFTMYNGEEKGAVINGVDYGTEAGYGSLQDYSNSTDGYVGREGDVISNDDPWWNDSAFRASLTFQYNNKDKAGHYVDVNGNIVDDNPINATFVPEEAKHLLIDEGFSQRALIDPSPYIDPVTGDRYLYLSVFPGGIKGMLDDNLMPICKAQSIYVVKMLDNDWSQVDYSSAVRCSRSDINMISESAVESYKQQALEFDPSKYELGVKEDVSDLDLHYADAELWTSQNGCNEGPFVYYNPQTGLYYMTISVSTYQSASYALIQLVAYKPTGPWRKLDLDEGGLMLATDNGKSVDNVTGPGHHSFIKTESDLLNIYHKHIDLTRSTSSRGAAVDRVIFVKNNAGLYVMHTNGPTTAPQPKFYGVDGYDYDIISDDAKITANVSSDKYNNLSYLNDEIIPIHGKEIHPHINDFEFTSSSITLTLDFSVYRAITSIMVYNAREYEKTFLSVKKIEMDFKKDGVEGTAIINNLDFYWDYNEQSMSDNLNPGGSAIAVFKELAVKTIRVTIDNPGGENSVCAIPEIYVVGKPDVNSNIGAGNATADTVKLDSYSFDNSKPVSVYGDVTLDGNITEEEWGNQNKFSVTTSIGGINHEIEASVKFTDDGLLMYWSVLGSPVYYNPFRGKPSNSGVEIFLTDGNATSALNNAWQIELLPNGVYGSHKYLKPGLSAKGYKLCNTWLDVAGIVDGDLNSADSNGYTLEAYIPWSTLGLDSAPDCIRMDGAILYCTSYNGERDAWYSLAKNLKQGYGWEDPQSWYIFDKDGWYDDTNFEGQDWRVSKYQSGVEIDDNGKIEVFSTNNKEWNDKAKKIYYNADFVGEVYQQTKVYSPKLQNSNLADELADPLQESALNGLFFTNGSDVLSLEMLYEYGVYRLRFASPYWTKYALNSKQIELYNTVGLTIGLYFDGKTFVAFIDDGNGNMVKALQVDASVKNFNINTKVSMGLNAICDSYFTDYVCYGGQDITTIPHVINNGQAVTNGSVSVTGSIKDNVVVIVIPEDGYVLDYFKVNGQNVDALMYQINAYSLAYLDIEVAFKQIDGFYSTFTVDYGFAYTDKTIYKSLPITFKNQTDTYYGITDGNGVAKVTLPNGTYTVLAQGCLPQTIVINSTQNNTNYDITLLREVISSYEDGIVCTDNGVDGATLVYDKTVYRPQDESAEEEPKFYYGQTVDYDGLVYTTFNLKIQSSVQCCVSIQFTGNGNSITSYYCNFVVWDKAVIYAKPYNSNDNVKTITCKTVNEDSVTYLSLDVMVVVDGSKAIIYYVDNTDGLKTIGTMDSGKDITGMNLRSAEHGGKWKATNIKVYDGNDAIDKVNDLTANLSVGETQQSTVTIDNTKLIFGNQTTIKVVPNDGYRVTFITINDLPCDFTTNADGSREVVFTFNDVSVKNYVIDVTTASATTVSANIVVKSKKINTTASPIADGTTLTISGTSGVYTATVSNGKIVLPQIIEGDYKITMDEYSSLSFQIGSSGFDGEVVLGYIAFAESPNADVSESGLGNIQFLKYTTENFYFKETGIQYVEARIVEVLDTASKPKVNDIDLGGTIFRFGDKANKSNSSSWGAQLLGPNAKNGGNGSSFYYRVRWTDKSWKSFTLSSAQQTALTTKGQGLKLALALVGNTAYGFVEDANGNLVLTASLVNDNGNWGQIFSMKCEHGFSTVTELYYSTTVPSDIMAKING
jgi:hypothetical protein